MLQSAGMSEKTFYPRYIEPRVLEALADTPAVLIHGARQCGKTTLAQMIGRKRVYAYMTFDDATEIPGTPFVIPVSLRSGLARGGRFDV